MVSSDLLASGEMTGIGYDWVGIAEDALGAPHVEDLSR